MKHWLLIAAVLSPAPFAAAAGLQHVADIPFGEPTGCFDAPSTGDKYFPLKVLDGNPLVRVMRRQ